MLASEQQQIHHLLVIEDGQGKRTVALENATYTIGRYSSNTIVLHSQLVSRQHAILLRVTKPDATYLFRIVDGNLQGKRSRNGLNVNGRRCFSHDLKHGDVIVFGGDVKVRYYATVSLADVELLTSGNEVVADFLPSDFNSSQTMIAADRELEFGEAALVRLASFPELISNPMLEIDLAGNITYLNPAAVVQFPDINETKLQHPILAELLSTVQKSKEKFFVREVEVANKVFEQSVHYIAESNLIRSYIVDITERKQTEAALRESEAKNRALLNAMPDLILRINKDGTYLDYMPAKDIEMLATDSDLLGRNEYEVLPPAVAQQRMHYLQLALSTGETQIFEYQLPVNGSIRYEEARIVVTGEDEVLAIVRDITERKQVEELLKQTHDELEHRVSQRTTALRTTNEQLRAEILERRRAEKEVRFLQGMKQAISETADFHSALEVTLRRVCNFTGWKFGEAWIPNTDARVLECSLAWYGNSQELEQFHRLSQEYTFASGVGLPGRVWESKYPEWIQDVSREPQTWFLRKPLAIAVGFKAGLGIPIVESDRVVAVLIFFMFESCEENRRLVEIVLTAATQVGSLIQRKRAEEALKESEERFRLLIENVKDYAIFMLDTSGNIVSWNIGAERIKGYRAEEIIGAHFSCFYPDEDIALGKPEKHLQICQEQGQLEEEGWRVRQDGSRLWANVILTALRDQDGKLRGFSKITRDITERQRAEEALRESEERLQAILDNSTALIYVKDTQGKYILINDWYSTLFHLDKEEVKGKTDYNIFPKDIADALRVNDQKVLENTTALELEEIVPQDDGIHTYLSIKFPLYDTAGLPYAVCGISTDITERKRVEAEMHNALEKEKQLSELKSRFVTMASHEFRTPLATILSSTELLEHYSHKWSEEKKLTHFQRIQAAVKHMTQLLNDVLLIGKAEAGKLEFKPTPLDLAQFCRELVEEVALTASNYKIAFQTQLQTITACMDEKLLRQILNNLLSNAIKYSPEGSTVRFDLLCEPEAAIFRVQDQGIGIPQSDQAQLFNSFHRASNVGNISGTGLGLAIVKKSVDLQRGKIAVESQVGVGTTFIVTLPLNYQG